MKPRPVNIEPDVNIHKSQRLFLLNKLIHFIVSWFKKGKFGALHFAVASTILVIVTLAAHDYAGNYVFVVYLNDQEVGTVGEAKDVEAFVDELTSRCADLYGMNMEPGDEIMLVKQYIPDSKLNPEAVESLIRQNMTFETEAFMLTVNGEPLVALQQENDLQIIIDQLKTTYSRSGYGNRLLSSSITDELLLEPCVVMPEEIYKPEDVVEMVTTKSEESSVMVASSVSNGVQRAALESRQSFTLMGAYDHTILAFLSPAEMMLNDDAPLNDNNNIHVRTVEEVIVTEDIPFETEIEHDEEMWIVQSEILVEGEKGEKEIVYHVTRDNDIEKARVKILESVITEPVTQVEAHGIAKVPSVGTGQFIWPVEGGGEVTPGRGFSNWHTGIDIHAQTGTNILAADSGVVWFSGYGGTQGNYLILYHGSFWTLYLHNSQNLVSEGMVVEQGDVIAKAGSTGRSTGPHLHFEVRLDDGTGEWHTYYQHKPIDPLQFFRP